MGRIHVKPRKAWVEDRYARIKQIDGDHRFKDKVPDGFVDYRARVRPGAKITYFNYDLAKDMGLIESDHLEKMNPGLEAALFETFSIVIINEYDEIHKKKFAEETIKAKRFMATRYLQLQHPNKKGATSGDGRGIWNGEFRIHGTTWDISSSGTGATCLSPAVAIEKKFFRTGDPIVAYGSGYNCVRDGLGTALMSEIFHQNNIETERTLLILEYSGGTSINVRASKNLIRPSHFFGHLKQENYVALKGMTDLFIERQIENRVFKKNVSFKRQVESMTLWFADQFARMAARFEREYIFCWVDWDGDNLLATGGIIDYGSIRQFGLFHDEYRYEDVDRFSTKVSEQWLKTRYVIQSFAQMEDYLRTGKKRKIRHFARSKAVRVFEETFKKEKALLLLEKCGYSRLTAENLYVKNLKAVKSFEKSFEFFERMQSRRGIYKVGDGVTSDAVFCMRDVLKKLPAVAMTQDEKWSFSDFTKVARSKYAKNYDLRSTRLRIQHLDHFLKTYFKLFAASGETWGDLHQRAGIWNGENRVTGDGSLHAIEALLRSRKDITSEEMHRILKFISKRQSFHPEVRKGKKVALDSLSSKERDWVERVLRVFYQYRQSL